MPAVCRRRSWIYFDRGNNDVLILRIVIPTPVKRASAVISARVGRRDLVFSFDGLRVFIKPRIGFLEKSGMPDAFMPASIPAVWRTAVEFCGTGKSACACGWSLKEAGTGKSACA